MEFAKYQALGNDYLVVEASALGALSAGELALALCDRHFGVGSDGVLVSQGGSVGGPFSLRIFNPDGSEAEKSGNGLRIHARYLWDRGLVSDGGFEVATPGGPVRCRVLEAGRGVSVEMGRVSFHSRDVPVTGPEREVLRERLVLAGGPVEISAASVGNPHCVVVEGAVSPERARELGPALERHAWFPNRTNVQLAAVEDVHRLRVEIWERGAGYTLASGSSACAAAAVACRLELCRSPVQVVMPGGQLRVQVSPSFDVVQTGPVEKVYEGVLSGEWMGTLRASDAGGD